MSTFNYQLTSTMSHDSLHFSRYMLNFSRTSNIMIAEMHGESSYVPCAEAVFFSHRARKEIKYQKILDLVSLQTQLTVPRNEQLIESVR